MKKLKRIHSVLEIGPSKLSRVPADKVSEQKLFGVEPEGKLND